MPLTSPRFAGNTRLQKAADNKPPLKIGEPKGSAVELVQQALVDLGYKMPVSFAKGSPDGIYGKETTGVVRRFQIDQGFAPSGWDGRAGRDTLTRLDQLFPGPKPIPPRPPLPPPPIPPRGGSQLPPIPLLPDFGQLIFAERNVDISGALKPDAVYDLALFRELGNPVRGVLVVTVILNFKFEDGVATQGPNKGAPLVWTLQEKFNFMAGFKTGVEATWGERHRLTTVGTSQPVSDVGVKFNLVTHERQSIFDHSHWNLTTTKVDTFSTSFVENGGGSFITNGEVTLDSQDLTPVNKGGPDKQRGAVHEFGHMMGYRDEYLNAAGAPEDNPHHTTDLKSILNSGESVRARHYVFFADWLTRQSEASTVWRVNGVTDLTNAQI